MKINGTDIRIFGARQHKVEFGHQTITFDNEWGAGSVLPFLGKSKTGFKQLTVTLVMRGRTRTEIMRNRSDLLSVLKDPVVIDLSNTARHFHGVLKSHKEVEVNRFTWHNMELSFDCYEYGDDVTVAGQSELVLNNPGNAPLSPCIISITPGISAAEITLTGICADPIKGTDLPVVIPDVETGKEIRIDGISGLITQDGELKEMDIWTLPAVKPGQTTITCDNRLMSIVAIARPIFI